MFPFAAFLMLLRDAGVPGMDPTSSCHSRSHPSTISPSSLCSCNIFGTVGGDGSPAGERHLHSSGFDANGLGSFSGVAGISTSVTCIAVPVYLIMQLWSSYKCVCVSVCRQINRPCFTRSLFPSLGFLSSSAPTCGLGRCSSDLDKQRQTHMSNRKAQEQDSTTASLAPEDPHGACCGTGVPTVLATLRTAHQ